MTAAMRCVCLTLDVHTKLTLPPSSSSISILHRPSTAFSSATPAVL